MNSVKMIRNNRLTVSIAKPDKYDFTQRFDRHGFITQVTLDGKDSFCTKEPEGCTNGVGICNEFGENMRWNHLSISANGKKIK